ncbi:hypothetical protein [Nitrobacter sp.]|uniref:hypothetical protein n=1 Tax=Nitrobacter sp. TaxID=29420 RepID=UPI003F649479
MSASDQTDTLETVATLDDKPEISEEQDAGNASESETVDTLEFGGAEEMLTTSPVAPEPSSDVDVPQDDAYTKFGPGPLTAVRFKWTTRRDDNGDYFVHETIGESSYPLISGPMTKEAAIEFVDDRERAARRRFEELRSEMAGGEIGRRADK